MLIDGQIIAISAEQERQACEQMELPSDFFLTDATRFLHHNTGVGVVQIPLPHGLVVAEFENARGKRRYGVVRIDGLKL